MMRVRKPFAAGFVVLLLLAASAGLAPNTLPQYKQSDKVLHFVTFFLITLCFYWILDTNRRRVINLTLLICTAALGIGSEVLQGLLPNGRDFDPYDIVANALGSGLALGACSWYHKRMIERKRQSKSYARVAGDEVDEEHDLELGETSLGAGAESQETGVVPEAVPVVSVELDNWDENADDWDDAEPADTTEANGDAQARAAVPAEDTADVKKRSD